jgi:hypothetical protein
VGKRRWLTVGFAVVVVCVAVLVPAASASKAAGRGKANLALVPLQKAQLGKVAVSLSLAHDSGAVPKLPVGSNNPLLWTSSTETFFSLDSYFLQKLGWVGGYTLDYGDAFSGCSCVTEIRTSVQRFKAAAGAKKLLGWWQANDKSVVSDSALGLTVGAQRLLNVPAIGTHRFAYLTTYTPTRATPVQIVDERFTDGRYLLQVEIASGTTNNGRALASKLAKKLDKRLHLALAHRLHARAAKLPAHLTAGPAPGGPDLSTLVLQQSDLAPGSAEVHNPSYALDPFALALSDYQLAYEPAGKYDQSLSQEIQWYPTANEAAFRSAYEEVFNTALWAPFSDAITPVNLDSIRQGERGSILRVVQGDPTGATDYAAVIAISRGRATDLVVAWSASPIRPSDVQTLAQSMATRLDASVTG